MRALSLRIAAGGSAICTRPTPKTSTTKASRGSAPTAKNGAP